MEQRTEVRFEVVETMRRFDRRVASLNDGSRRARRVRAARVAAVESRLVTR